MLKAAARKQKKSRLCEEERNIAFDCRKELQRKSKKLRHQQVQSLKVGPLRAVLSHYGKLPKTTNLKKLKRPQLRELLIKAVDDGTLFHGVDEVSEEEDEDEEEGEEEEEQEEDEEEEEEEEEESDEGEELPDMSEGEDEEEEEEVEEDEVVEEEEFSLKRKRK